MLKASEYIEIEKGVQMKVYVRKLHNRHSMSREPNIGQDIGPENFKKHFKIQS